MSKNTQTDEYLAYLHETDVTTIKPASQFTFWELIEKLGCHVEPYPGGGAQVFIGRADIVNAELFREFWNLSDAHVTGALSGPSLHIAGNTIATPANA